MFAEHAQSGHYLLAPLDSDIVTLEDSLVLFLEGLKKRASQRPPADEYDRQYIGVISKGARLIYGSFYSPGFGDPGTSKPMIICDGGPSLWGVVFDPKTDTFSNLEFNGEA